MKLRETAFYILGVNTHHNKEEIHSRADAKSFFIDETLCKNLERALCNPNSRIEHEVAWLPGVASGESDKLLAMSRADDFMSLYHKVGESAYPAIVWCNLLAYVFPVAQRCVFDAATARHLLAVAAKESERMDAGTLQETLNADRRKSQFPLITDMERIQEALNAQRKELYSAARDFLHGAIGLDETKVLTRVAESIYLEQAGRGSDLLDKLVADYELQKHDEMEQKAKAIKSLLDAAAATIGQGQDLPKNCDPSSLDEIIRRIAEWHALARPVLLSFKSRGLSWTAAEELVCSVRKTYLALYREHQCETLLEKLVDAVSFTIDEIPQFAEAVSDDIDFVSKLHPQERKIRCIESFFGSFFVVPDTHDLLVSSYSELLRKISEKANRDGLDEQTGDACALLLLKYAAADANKFGRFAEAAHLLKPALAYAKSKEVRALLQANADKLASNQEHMDRRFHSYGKQAMQNGLRNTPPRFFPKRFARITVTAMALAAAIVFAVVAFLNTDCVEDFYMEHLSNAELIHYAAGENHATRAKVSKELLKRIEREPFNILEAPSLERYKWVVDERDFFRHSQSSSNPFFILAYQKMFPDAFHLHEKELEPAFHKAIDSMLYDISCKPHTSLDPGKDSDDYGLAYIDITNYSDEVMYALYSGPEHKVVRLPSVGKGEYASTKVVLKPGMYKVAYVSVRQRVRPMYGDVNIAPGRFAESIRRFF